MKRILLVCASVLCSCVFVRSQSTISTDRPNQTYAVTVEGKGIVQVETGVLLDRLDLETGSALKSNFYGQTFVRIGTGSNLEFQVATSYATLKSDSTDTGGLTPLLLGAKIKVAEENGIWPAISFIGNVRLPWIGDKDLRPEHVAPNFRFIFAHTLSDRFGIAYNLGIAWDGFDPNPIYEYTLLFTAGVINKLGAYVELFGFLLEENPNRHSFDFGLTYLLTNNIQLDASYGRSFSDPDGHYFNFGASFRFGSARVND